MRVTARRLGAGWGDVSPLVGFTVVSHAAGSRTVRAGRRARCRAMGMAFGCGGTRA